MRCIDTASGDRPKARTAMAAAQRGSPSRRLITNTRPALINPANSMASRPANTAWLTRSKASVIQVHSESWIHPKGGWSYQYV